MTDARAETGQWHMTMCFGPDTQLVVQTFPSVEAWEVWLRQNHPRIMEDWSSLTDPWSKQYGTGYFWSQVTYTSTSLSSGSRP